MPKYIITAFALLLSVHTMSCDNHFGSFGFGPHSPANNYAAASAATSPFTLKLPTMAYTEPNKTSEFDLTYTMPKEAKNVKISVKGIGNIGVETKEIALKKTEGEKTVKFTAIKPGYHSLIVTISGLYEGKDQNYSERIYVRAKSKE